MRLYLRSDDEGDLEDVRYAAQSPPMHLYLSDEEDAQRGVRYPAAQSPGQSMRDYYDAQISERQRAQAFIRDEDEDDESRATILYEPDTDSDATVLYAADDEPLP